MTHRLTYVRYGMYPRCSGVKWSIDSKYQQDIPVYKELSTHIYLEPGFGGWTLQNKGQTPIKTRVIHFFLELVPGRLELDSTYYVHGLISDAPRMYGIFTYIYIYIYP